jgi:hypothetical protein
MTEPRYYQDVKEFREVHTPEEASALCKAGWEVIKIVEKPSVEIVFVVGR